MQCISVILELGQVLFDKESIWAIYPSVTTTLKWKTKLFRLPNELARELERAAFESRVNQTTYLIQLLQKHFNKKTR